MLRFFYLIYHSDLRFISVVFNFANNSFFFSNCTISKANIRFILNMYRIDWEEGREKELSKNNCMKKRIIYSRGKLSMYRDRKFIEVGITIRPTIPPT